MCRFKSGIILKSKIVVAQGDNDSHSDLLESLGIKDDYMGASKTFVRAELVPKNNEWWVNPQESPDSWNFIVDQDITPDWFDKDEHEKLFREAVCSWWNEHVLVDKKIDILSDGYYRLKRCEVKKLCNDVKVMCDSSTVQEMYGSSTVQVMYGSSTVQKMYGSSTVQEMYGSSTVQEMYDSSTVQVMCDSSTVQKMCDSSTVQKMYDSSTVQKMYGNTIARDYANEVVRISSYSALNVIQHENKEK